MCRQESKRRTESHNTGFQRPQGNRSGSRSVMQRKQTAAERGEHDGVLADHANQSFVILNPFPDQAAELLDLVGSPGQVLTEGFTDLPGCNNHRLFDSGEVLRERISHFLVGFFRRTRSITHRSQVIGEPFQVEQRRKQAP